MFTTYRTFSTSLKKSASILFLGLILQNSFAVTPASTPNEGQILFEDGRTAFGLGNYPHAVAQLQRVVNLFPGSPGTHSAQLLLGLSQLRLQNPQSAIPPLKSFSEAEGLTPEGMRARLALARAYLEVHQPSNTLMVLLEIQKHRIPAPSEIAQGARLIQTWALLDLKHEKRAHDVFSEFQKNGRNLQQITPYITEATRLAVEFQTRKCSGFLPNSGVQLKPTSEEQTVRDLHLRSQCIQESFNLFLIGLSDADRNGENPSDRWMNESRDQLANHYFIYLKICDSPPANASGSKNQVESERYRLELKSFLNADCQRTQSEIKKTLDQWKEKIPNLAKIQIDLLEKQLYAQ